MNNHLLFVSLEDWDEIWRRNQFICAKLAERNHTLRILFIQPALDLSNAIRTGRLAQLFQPREKALGPEGRIICTRPLKLLPNSWAWGRKINEWMMRRHVRSTAQRLGLEAPVLWINAHGAVHMVGKMEEKGVVYDITDDWTELSQSAALRRLTTAQDAELCCRADAVIVCSEKLYEKCRRRVRHLHLAPNGVDAAHYAQVLDGAGPLPPETSAWHQPVFGYTGSIHPDRVDLDLVEKIANEFPQGTVALVGPIMLAPKDLRRLQACRNVVLTGPVPYQRIPEFMRAFDVSITPHRVTPFTESLNPIKLWEYLAAGKPIVSTNVAGFRAYPELVRIAADREHFLRQLGHALSETSLKSAARRLEAERHSWDVRARQIETIFEDLAYAKSSVPSGAEPAPGGPRVSALIVNYNTRAMTLDCLKTLEQELRGIPSEIILVDNASSDGSVAAIQAEHPAVRVIANPVNAGFGAANNQAMQQAGGELFLLLNTDAFPKPGAIRALVEYLDRHPKAAAVGPRLLNANGSLQVSCHRFPSPLRAWLDNMWISAALSRHPGCGDYRRWLHDSERTVDWVIGACMLVRREVVDQIGGFDESFFMYAEETDWQRRMRDQGWEIAFTPTAEVTHLGGASGAAERARINRNFFESLDRYERKHHGLPGLISLRCAMVLGCGLRTLLWAGAWLIQPERRVLAQSKARLHSWLFVRQTTHWKL